MRIILLKIRLVFLFLFTETAKIAITRENIVLCITSSIRFLKSDLNFRQFYVQASSNHQASAFRRLMALTDWRRWETVRSRKITRKGTPVHRKFLSSSLMTAAFRVTNFLIWPSSALIHRLTGLPSRRFAKPPARQPAPARPPKHGRTAERTGGTSSDEGWERDHSISGGRTERCLHLSMDVRRETQAMRFGVSSKAKIASVCCANRLDFRILTIRFWNNTWYQDLNW